LIRTNQIIIYFCIVFFAKKARKIVPYVPVNAKPNELTGPISATAPTLLAQQLRKYKSMASCLQHR